MYRVFKASVGAVIASLIVLTVLSTSLAVTARAADPPAFQNLTVVGAYKLGHKADEKPGGHVGIGDIIVVTVKPPEALSSKPGFNLMTTTALYLDNREMKGVVADTIDPISGSVHFRLNYDGKDPDNVKSWSALLGNPSFEYGKFFERPISVSIGAKGKGARPTAVTGNSFFITRVGGTSFWLGAILLAVIVIIGAVFLRKKDFLRDPGPEPTGGKDKKRPYSLARVQMGLWFLAVLWSAMFIWLITNDYNVTFTLTALGLLGISAGTTGIAYAIDGGKDEGFNKAVDELKAGLMASNNEMERLIGVKKTQEDELAKIDKLDKGKAGLVEELKARTKRLEEIATELTKPTATAEVVAGFTKEQQGVSDRKAELEKAIADMDTESGKRPDINKSIVATGSQIDALKSDVARLAKELEEMTTSQGFLTDILTDMNGNSMHRYQIFGWTLVLMFMFISNVWTRVAMPEFNATMLALMGFSNGTYLWFKNQPAKPGV